jgi:eukaryotic-like serine/threonine-protein kinase
MSLSAGHKLGPYEIQALIGEGGMGEVYRARDTRLGRDVAIKVSRERFTERFDREARAISSLNHPNICALYDVAPDYLVMEYVDGDSPRGPMLLDDALPIAMQIADALREAHEKGIVHRDLKPANLRITPDGKVKVLDFGLAKAMEPSSGAGAPASAGQLRNSPTITSPAMTHAGMILGTAAYMAPEQARGKAVDTRADIWAFGVVLYELLTGERPFKGDDLTETLAAVVKDQPDLGAVPPRVRRLLEACLQKDPKKRLQSIGDIGLLLADAAIPAPMPPGRGFAPAVTFAVAALALLATLGFAALAFVHFREATPAGRALRLSIPIPDDSAVGYVDLSPDGTRLLLLMMVDGSTQLYVRSLEADDLQPLAGTNNARTPFWSADSRSVGFFADGRLKTIPASGGPVRVLCETAGLGSGGTWNRDGVILWSGGTRYIRRVDATGGECRPLGTPDPTFAAFLPTFLPDGKHFFYVGGKILDGASGGVYLASLDEPVGRRVLEDQSGVLYAQPAASGGRAHLLFLREGTLMAQPFDETNLQAVGDPFPVVQRASFTLTPPQLAASASADGTLVYLAGRSRESQLQWFDRTGAPLGAVGPKGNQAAVRLSPDGNMVAITRNEPSDPSALWVHDLVRGSASRVTPVGNPSGFALWSPDSSRMLFHAATAGEGIVYQRDFRNGQQEIVSKTGPPNERQATDWSPDGRFVIYTTLDSKTRADIWYAPVESGWIDDKAAVKILGTEAAESQGQLSPDGKWLAYASAETAIAEVYVRPFPTGAGVRKVTTAGGQEPRWSADGKELYFTSVQGRRIAIWAAAIESDGRAGLRTGTPRKLFEASAERYILQNNVWTYSPHPDGKRFLVNALTETSEPTVNVITNWQQAVTADVRPR